MEEDYQGQGLARTIMRHLAAIARSRGIAFFDAEVLPENKAMLAAFRPQRAAHDPRLRRRRCSCYVVPGR